MPVPYYEADGVAIYLGDCREILPALDADLFAALLVDPPYGIDYQSNWPGLLPRAIVGDATTELRDSILAWWGDDRPALVFGSWKVAKPANVRAQLIYDKGGATGMGDLSIPWKPSHEEIYVIGGPWSGTRDSGSVLQGRVQASAWRGRMHPHEKDVRTLQALVRKCPVGRILDPCSGSGSALVAAKNVGREAVGIEIEERYCEIAAKRLGQMVLDMGNAA